MSLAAAECGTITESVFHPIRADYADFSVEVPKSFRWGAIFDRLFIPTEQEVALYAFRSIKRPDADIALLGALDEKALLAAEEAEGFIHYQPLESLSYCLWESRAAAEAATSAEAHREAAKYAVQAYERWELNCWMAAKSAVSGQVEFAQVR